MCQTTTSNLFKQWIVASLPHRETLLISADVYFRKTLYSSKDVYSDWVWGVCICVYVCVHASAHEYVCLGSIECLQSKGLVSDPRPFLRQDQAHPTSHHTWTDTTFPQDRLNFLKHPFDNKLTHNCNSRDQGWSPLHLLLEDHPGKRVVPEWLRCSLACSQ